MRKENLKTRPIALTLQRVEPRVDSLEKIFLARRIRDPVKPNPASPFPRGESSQTFPSRKIAPLASTTTANARVSAAKRLRFMGILPRLSITNDVDGRLFTIYDTLV